MRALYDTNLEFSSCGVGFITHKHSEQTHELLELTHQALCKIPHRGGFNAVGVGDGAGVNVDISLAFYQHLTGDTSLELGQFGVANFFYPRDREQYPQAEAIIKQVFADHGLGIILWRDVPVNKDTLNERSAAAQLDIHQVVFSRPQAIQDQNTFERLIHEALEAIEQPAFEQPELKGFYPLSMSSRTQVYKGRLNSWEVIPYFADLSHPEHKIHTLFFHTRFSTNTAPNLMFAQPFRRMAHNGELNTDRKNRLSEDAIARSHGKHIVFPQGQSDSARLDQTLARRIIEDRLEIDTAALVMMPPAWENDPRLSPNVRDMLEYFSLYEEKNDGPAALIFSDGVKVGARLDRLGLRPLRSVETEDYLAVMSEAGQIDFPPESVIRRGRVEAGGMIVFDHEHQRIEYTDDVLERLAQEKDYSAILQSAHIDLEELPAVELSEVEDQATFSTSAYHVVYSMNQESFKFMLDPMMQNGAEKISAMGYGIAPNALTNEEGGLSRYFSQRFAQVTNPPLDSIREADGMTLRVALGQKPNFSTGDNKQIVIASPILQPQQLVQVFRQQQVTVEQLDMLYTPDFTDADANVANLTAAINTLCDQVEALAKANCSLIVLTDKNVDAEHAAIPALLAVSAANQRLIQHGLRFNSSLIVETGQASSTHDIACILGFGASAVCPTTVYRRARELYQDDESVLKALNHFQKAVEKALMKTMGKFGLCTAESYIGGEFFEANFIDTEDPVLKKIFPNIHSPVGGARFSDIAENASDWHQRALKVENDKDIPLLGLFKERSDGAGHSYGTIAVREFGHLTDEAIHYAEQPESEQPLLLPQDISYKKMGYEACTDKQIDEFEITPAYRSFLAELYTERAKRPAALRDVLAIPVNFKSCSSVEDFRDCLGLLAPDGNIAIAVQGLTIHSNTDENTVISLLDANAERTQAFMSALRDRFATDISDLNANGEQISISHQDSASEFFRMLRVAPEPISVAEVQAAHEITPTFSSGAMSHGALVAKAHEAVAQGINIVGGMSNCGEGGEHSRRYNTIKASKIKQFASGRFGVWVGYLADPHLEEIEIKIAQGAKPGEGGQLPAAKVTVEIAAARGGTPGVELVSPPPHHDTYSIEDLGQLIHDAKAARVRVIVKLVSSEGVGTIAVGVAKAGASVINIAGSTGGTGAAQVTSLKNSGRAAEIGIAEVHQALDENGLRERVILRCSNAHQTGMDVIKSAMLGADSYEFGTTALMMLKCVMAKNCNVKCPAGLTTNPEVYEGDPRALAQYFINLAHEVREILAALGFKTLREIRGRRDLLHLIDHPTMNGQLDMAGLLALPKTKEVQNPVALEPNFSIDDGYIDVVRKEFFAKQLPCYEITDTRLTNSNKTTGGQFAIDVERHINYEMTVEERATHPAIDTLGNGRSVLRDDSIVIRSHNSAGQSFGAFNNSGISLYHSGTCNDGVGKGCSGGRITVTNPGSGCDLTDCNVLVGNFALFGATGGELFVEGQAGDRFGVRNSGAVAVVEGVGDFCCEYMTNGSIVNLGSYGKGFGNGMSGGVAYQYDPEGLISELASHDSVMVTPLNEGSELMQGQEIALRMLIERHIEHTGSVLAKQILNDWEQSRNHFYVMIPRALYSYHCSDAILKSIADRKKLLEELSHAWGLWHLRRVADAYRNKRMMFSGQVPNYGDHDTVLIYQYVNAMGVLRRAIEVAEKSDIVKNGVVSVDAVARNLIETEDRKLLDQLFKDVKEALKDYSDQALASLLADKRVRDYKESLILREVADIRAWGTSVWIILRDRDNHQELKNYPMLEESLASHYTQVLAEAMSQAA